jgi:chromosome segregation ATPase
MAWTAPRPEVPWQVRLARGIRGVIPIGAWLHWEKARAVCRDALAALDALDKRDEEVAGLRAEVERWRLAAEDRREEARAADAQAERLRGERAALLVHLKNLGANVASLEEERDALRARLAEVERELAEGRALAGEAIDKLEEASAYVDRYFREKWGFTDEDIAALRARLAGKKG